MNTRMTDVAVIALCCAVTVAMAALGHSGLAFLWTLLSALGVLAYWCTEET